MASLLDVELLQDRQPQSPADFLRSAVLRKHGALAVQRHDQMAAFTGGEGCAFLGQITLDLGAVHSRNISVVPTQVNKSVALYAPMTPTPAFRADPTLKLNPLLRLHARREMMLHRRHLGDEIGRR